MVDAITNERTAIGMLDWAVLQPTLYQSSETC